MPLDDTQLTAFLLGLLDKDEREAVEHARRVSSETATELDALAETLSQVARAAAPLRPSPRVLSRLLNSLEPSCRFEASVERLATFFDLGIDRVRALLRAVDAAPGGPWEASGVSGTRLLHFEGGPRVATADCGLVYIEPGRTFPRHRHLGDEWVFILQGRSQEEETGRLTAPGDLVHKAKGSIHTVHILGDVPLVFAVVLYGGLQIIKG